MSIPCHLSGSILYVYYLLKVKSETTTLAELFWFSLVRVLDPGVMGYDKGSWSFLIIVLLTSIAGIIIISTLISILTTGLVGRLEEIKKGRSRVYEKKHIAILGWSPKIYTIIEQLINGHSLTKGTRKRLCITILADMDKTEMEDLIEDNCPNSRRARIVCRSGNPILLEKLEKLSLHMSETILVMSRSIPDPDSYVMKTVLALSQIFRRENHSPDYIVVEIMEYKNVDMIEDAFKAHYGKCQLIPIVPNKIISQLIVQTSLQPGLSKVYEELLSFNEDDNEIYMITAAKLDGVIGKEFKDCLCMFPDSSLIGLKKTDKTLIVNPLVDHTDIKIEGDDKLICIAKSKQSIRIEQLNVEQGNLAFVEDQLEETVDNPIVKTLILGWNSKIYSVIGELENYIAKGSATTIAANIDFSKSNGYLSKLDMFENELSKMGISYNWISHNKESHILETGKQEINLVRIPADIPDEEILGEKLGNFEFDHIIILCYSGLVKDEKTFTIRSDIARMETSDSKTIQTLLNLRSRLEQLSVDNKNEDKDKDSRISTISEIEFAHNKEIAPRVGTNDFIISDSIISDFFAQVAFNKYKSIIFSDVLFSSIGSEFYLKDVKCYIPFNNTEKVTVNFYQVVNSAMKRKEIAVGYYSEVEGGIVLNPKKQKEIEFGKSDRILTLAEEYRFI